MYSSRGEMSRLDICAEHVEAAPISAPRDNDLLTTRTSALEDGSEQVVCLYADLLLRNNRFPRDCPTGKHCCLVDERYWDEDKTPSADRSEHLFS